MDCQPPSPWAAPPSPGACGRAAAAAPAPAPPAPQPRAGSLNSCGHLLGPSLSHVPRGRTRTAGRMFASPSAKPAWCGAPVEPRAPPDSHGARSTLPSPAVPGSALRAGRGQEGGGVAEPALPGRSGSGAPPRGGWGRSGRAALPGQGLPLRGPGRAGCSAAQLAAFSGEELRGAPGQPPERRLKRLPGRAGSPPPCPCPSLPGQRHRHRRSPPCRCRSGAAAVPPFLLRREARLLARSVM